MKAKRLLANIGIFALSCFIIAYIIIQLVGSMSVDLECQYADIAKIEDFIQTTGYIFRNETLVFSQKEGIVNYQVKEAEKVYIDQDIATIYKNNNYLSIKKEISEIDNKIDILEKSAVETSYMASNVTRLDKRILSYINQIKLSVLNNDITSTGSIKKNMLISYNKRYLITNNISNFDDKKSSLINRKSKLTVSDNESAEIVKSPKAGYFSTILDGYELSFNSDKINDMTVDSFNAVLTSPIQGYGPKVIGKIATDFEWYTGVIVSNEEAEDFVVSRNYPIIFLYSTGEKINANLYRKITQTDSDKTVLIFKIDKVYSGFDYTRSQTVKIIKNTHSGISVPKSSVRIVNDKVGVYILEGSTVHFKQIQIASNDENSYLCSETSNTEVDKENYLSKYDKIITIGKDLYEGRIIN